MYNFNLIKKNQKTFFDFWEVGEVRKAAIFFLGCIEEVGLDAGWFEAGYKTHRVASYDLETPTDALDNQIGPLVWPLRFEVIKPEPLKTEIWEIPVFSIGTFIGSKILHEQAAATPKLDAPKL